MKKFIAVILLLGLSAKYVECCSGGGDGDSESEGNEVLQFHDMWE